MTTHVDAIIKEVLGIDDLIYSDVGLVQQQAEYAPILARCLAVAVEALKEINTLDEDDLSYCPKSTVEDALIEIEAIAKGNE